MEAPRPRPEQLRPGRSPFGCSPGLRGQHGLKGIARRESLPSVLGGSGHSKPTPCVLLWPAGLPQEEPGPSSVGSCQPGLGPGWVPRRPGLPGVRDPGAAGVNQPLQGPARSPMG